MYTRAMGDEQKVQAAQQQALEQAVQDGYDSEEKETDDLGYEDDRIKYTSVLRRVWRPF